VPVLRVLVNDYPNLKLTVLTKAFFKPFFEDLPNVSVLSADVKVKHKGFFGLYKLSKEVKSLDVDAVADLHNVLRSNVIKRLLSNTQFVQIDKGRKEKKALVSGKQFKQLKSTHQRYADVFKSLGFAINLDKPVSVQEKSLSDKSLKLVGEKNEKWIGIAPFATYQGKMYPMRLMETVIESLSKEHKVLLFGGGSDELEVLNNLEVKHDNVVTVAGKLTLTEELEIISKLDVMLSMDSGNAHIAAMLNKKVITIWGVTHPFAGFYPFNQPEKFAVLSDRKTYPKIPTSIYGNTYPDGYSEASKSIDPQQVIDKVKSAI